MFAAGAAWAGLPACLLAWCGTGRPARGVGLDAAPGVRTCRRLCRLAALRAFPEIFLPEYRAIAAKYHDFAANPDLSRLYRDNGATMRHIGYCLGFLLFEAVRRDWKNVALISTVGLLNGAGWAACQNWKWAAHVWPDAHFNFWRCWECCGGISIGIAFGVAWFLVNRREVREAEAARERRSDEFPLWHGWLLAGGLLLAIGCVEFWPVPTDLRQKSPALTPVGSEAWGTICLAAALLAALASLVRRSLGSNVEEENGTRKRGSLELATEIGLMLLLAWFIRKEVIAGFGDGIRKTTEDWFRPGNIYFGIVAAYCLARLVFRTRPWEGWRWRLDWLATYLEFTVILLAAIGAHMQTSWNAPIWFGIVAAAFGIGYVLVSRYENSHPVARGVWCADANLERWALFVALVYGLGLSLRKTLKGGAEVYLGNEDGWDRACWEWVALLMLVCLAGGMVWLLSKRLPADYAGDRFPHASAVMWLVLIAENGVAQIVTGPWVGPHASWDNSMFNLLYLILFAITGVIVYHFQLVKRSMPSSY